MNQAPIGIFDSGVGGLSVLREVRARFPNEDLLFLADQAHVPYGPRSLAEVRQFSEAITRYFIQQDAKLVVVACNTASAAALHHLRATFPELPFVGMEPAVKPAAEQTESGVVGVLATPATFQGALYASVVERFAKGVRILQSTCPGLVEQIELGHLARDETRHILERALAPMLKENIDTIVLGCTHYPFVIPVIQQIAGPRVRVIDPAPAIAKQVGRLLDQHALHSSANHAGETTYLTTGEPSKFLKFLDDLGFQGKTGSVYWNGAQIEENGSLQA